MLLKGRNFINWRPYIVNKPYTPRGSDCNAVKIVGSPIVNILSVRRAHNRNCAYQSKGYFYNRSFPSTFIHRKFQTINFIFVYYLCSLHVAYILSLVVEEALIKHYQVSVAESVVNALNLTDVSIIYRLKWCVERTGLYSQ